MTLLDLIDKTNEVNTYPGRLIRAGTRLLVRLDMPETGCRAYLITNRLAQICPNELATSERVRRHWRAQSLHTFTSEGGLIEVDAARIDITGYEFLVVDRVIPMIQIPDEWDEETQRELEEELEKPLWVPTVLTRHCDVEQEVTEEYPNCVICGATLWRRP
jgi:hypothetical protein